VKVFAAEPLDLGLPQVRTLVVVEKTSARKGTDDPPAATCCLYLSSHHPRDAEYFARLVRGHWAGCEIRNHWVRDALFEEDGTRSRNLNLNSNLALLRGALIAVKARLCPDLPWPALHQICSMKPATAYNLVFRNRFK